MPFENRCDEDLLARLGAGAPIQEVGQQAGFSLQEFSAWWRHQLESRLPQFSGTVHTRVGSQTRILRGDWGIPQVVAGSDYDLFFGYGYAMAQDRLWQLDYFRRQAQGRLCEILGAEARPTSTGTTVTALERDTIARTLGFHRIAAARLKCLPEQTHSRLQAFCDGINSCMEASLDHLPIEFPAGLPA